MVDKYGDTMKKILILSLLFMGCAPLVGYKKSEPVNTSSPLTDSQIAALDEINKATTLNGKHFSTIIEIMGAYTRTPIVVGYTL